MYVSEEALMRTPNGSSWGAHHLAQEVILTLILNARTVPGGTGSELHLLAGEEYLDLDALGRGVQRAAAGMSTAGCVLARSAVPDPTWSAILTRLTRSRLPAAPVRL
jgi:hypothetical protein